MTLLLIYLFTAIVVSFLCSVSEAVILSVTPSYTEVLNKKKAWCANLLAKQKRDLDGTLAAILSLNTIAHTIGAVGVGAQTTIVFGDQYVGVASGVMTLLILLLSEIIPKSIGAAYWRLLAPSVSVMVKVLIFLMYPFVLISERLSKLFCGKKDRSLFRHDEFKALASLGGKEGKLNENESRIVKNLFRLRNLTVRDIMTPRTVVFSQPASMRISDVIKSNETLPFSRIPIYGKSRDDIKGFVLKNDILYQLAMSGEEKTLESLRRKLYVVNDWTSLSSALEFLLEERQHIVMVTNEFGAFDGVVTLEDTVETLLGLEIVDEVDQTIDMRALARRKWGERIKKMQIKMPPEIQNAISNDLVEEKHRMTRDAEPKAADE